MEDHKRIIITEYLLKRMRNNLCSEMYTTNVQKLRYIDQPEAAINKNIVDAFDTKERYINDLINNIDDILNIELMDHEDSE